MFEEVPREGGVFGVLEKGLREMGRFVDPHL